MRHTLVSRESTTPRAPDSDNDYKSLFGLALVYICASVTVCAGTGWDHCCITVRTPHAKRGDSKHTRPLDPEN